MSALINLTDKSKGKNIPQKIYKITPLVFTVHTVSKEVMAEVEKEFANEPKLNWCECKHSDAVTFRDNGECQCGIYKHHYHCQECELVCQIG